MGKGKPDRAKGSFFANPFHDDPTGGDKDVIDKCNQALPNVWPEELPELEAAFKNLSKLVFEVAKPIVRQVDRLVTNGQNASDSSCLFDRTFLESKLHVARLLHYYGTSEDDDLGEWCGWHNDNSTITGLVPGLWLDEETGCSVPAPEGAGLFVEGRNGEQVEVKTAKGCLAFQVGEAAQILSGGIVHATPHMVKCHKAVAGGPKLCRESFALFIQPNWDCLLRPPTGVPHSSIFEGRDESKLIPPLRERLQDKPTAFGELLQRSFQEYYKMNNPE